VLIPGLYLPIPFIAHRDTGIYIYKYMNPAEGPRLAGFIIALLAGGVGGFVLVNLTKYFLAKYTKAVRAACEPIATSDESNHSASVDGKLEEDC
jgi:hypothetical protein